MVSLDVSKQRAARGPKCQILLAPAFPIFPIFPEAEASMNLTVWVPVRKC